MLPVCKERDVFFLQFFFWIVCLLPTCVRRRRRNLGVPVNSSNDCSASFIGDFKPSTVQIYVGLSLVSRTVNRSRRPTRIARMKHLNLTPSAISVFLTFFAIIVFETRTRLVRTRTRPFPARSPRSHFRGTAHGTAAAGTRTYTRICAYPYTCVMVFTCTRGYAAAVF